MPDTRRSRTAASLALLMLASACSTPASPDATYASQVDVIAALEDGGYACERVDLRVRDREDQELIDSSPEAQAQTGDAAERADARMIDNELALEARGIAGWSTCWWEGGRLDVFTHDTERQRLSTLISGFEFGCTPGPGLEDPAYVGGTDWVVSSSDFATGVDVMERIATEIGGRANETSCAELEAFLDDLESGGRSIEDLTDSEMKAALGE
jgi:hypothetical protein